MAEHDYNSGSRLSQSCDVTMESASDPGRVIAFYSFKGGTGRSMALANVGCTLAGMPELVKPVLLIDWDLEAPGLHRYFRKQLFEAFRGSEQVQEESPGLIDLFIELRHRMEQLEAGEPQELESAAKMLADLRVEDYIVKTDIPRLHLLKAGRFDKGYAERISTFDWPDLYRNSPYMLKAFAARLMQDYSYVLIDSRTGLTDTSSICTMLLPEILVTVFTPNRQSLAGVIDLIMDAGRYRLQSEDLRPLVIYPLPSRIEASEPALRQQWRHGDAGAGIEGFQYLFEKAFTEIYALPACDLTGYFDDVQIQHAPRYAYGEELAVLVEESRDRFSLTTSFQRFAKRLAEARPPWATLESAPSMAEDIVLDNDLATSAGEAASKRREAAAYLQRIEEPTRRLRKSLTRFSLVERISTYLLPAALSLITAFAYSSGASGIWPVLVFAVFGAGGFSIIKDILSTRREHLESSIETINEEVDDFKNGRPPYETGEALARLKERIDPIIPSPGSTSSRGDKTVRGSGRIFISYLRSDRHYAGRLYDSLATHFGADRVFMDVDSIPIGQDFVIALREMMETASVVLVVIGPGWSRALREGGGRLGNFVETEVALALEQKILTIPILVGNSGFPNASELPEALRPLLRRNGLEVNDARWRADVVRLTDQLDRLFKGGEPN